MAIILEQTNRHSNRYHDVEDCSSIIVKVVHNHQSLLILLPVLTDMFDEGVCSVGAPWQMLPLSVHMWTHYVDRRSKTPELSEDVAQQYQTPANSLIFSKNRKPEIENMTNNPFAVRLTGITDILHPALSSRRTSIVCMYMLSRSG